MDPKETQYRKLDLGKLGYPTSFRLLKVKEAMEEGHGVNDIHEQTSIDPWFLDEIKAIVDFKNQSVAFNKKNILQLKKEGFSDIQIATKFNKSELDVRNFRKVNGILPTYKVVDTCAAEFEALTPYCYSTYEEENEAIALPGKKAVVIGSGPIRIGQGIEFDYCSVHAAWALQEDNVKSIMINSNPETVSTDFDTSDRLYFEPLDDESVRDIIDNESDGQDNKSDSITPVVVQFGGQTAINLSQSLNEVNIPILGSSAKSIDIASDRHLFEDFLLVCEPSSSDL